MKEGNPTFLIMISSVLYILPPRAHFRGIYIIVKTSCTKLSPNLTYHHHTIIFFIELLSYFFLTTSNPSFLASQRRMCLLPCFFINRNRHLSYFLEPAKLEKLAGNFQLFFLLLYFLSLT